MKNIITIAKNRYVNELVISKPEPNHGHNLVISKINGKVYTNTIGTIELDIDDADEIVKFLHKSFDNQILC